MVARRSTMIRWSRFDHLRRGSTLTRRLIGASRPLLAFCLVLFAGCATTPTCCPRLPISAEIAARTSHDSHPVDPGEFVLPADANLEDGINEDEAIATALSNNAAFQATLAELGMAQGDVVQAGLLTNPSLATFFPVSVKQWEWVVYMPVETILLRPARLGIAESDRQRVADQLVQNGLALVRDVRVAYADLAVANAQWQLGEEAVKIRQSIADLTRKRLERGDISELEEMTARIDALTARATAAALKQNVFVASAKLRQLMGLPVAAPELRVELSAPFVVTDIDAPALIDQALVNRPDLHAATWAVDAAMKRARLAHWTFLRIDVAADANGTGKKGFEIGPALRLDLPIFNRNQGGVLRSEAEVEQALRRRDAVHDQIVQEIRTAAAQYLQAKTIVAILGERVVPALDEALRIAEKGFADGGASYLLVLQTTSQYLDAKARLLDQTAALRRARAQLEFSLGGRLPAEPELLPPPLPDSIQEDAS